jgi:hypothetical protein
MSSISQAQPAVNALIRKDFHEATASIRTFFFAEGNHLLTRNAGKPIEEIIDNLGEVKDEFQSSAPPFAVKAPRSLTIPRLQVGFAE